MRNQLLMAAAPALALLLSACGGSKTPACQGVTGTCVALDEGASESKVAAAFAQAAAGSTVAFGEGTFRFTNTLNLAAKNVTVKGAGLDKTVLDFSGQAAGAGGLLVSDGSDGTVLVDFTIRDTKGDGIKVVGSNGVTFRRLKAIWTGANPTLHGSYGFYPVQSQNVLIEDSVVIGASDAGIYVGQSKNIIVRRNRAEQNVAGIEIESSFDADVYENTAQDNVGGILVFDLPNLPQEGGHNVRVFNNTMRANNRLNFSAPGATVHLIPAGTGFLVMANHDVEVFGNQILDNNTGGSAVISYFVTGNDPKQDPHYYPYPLRVYLHDNTFVGNGTSPDGLNGIGTLLLLSIKSFNGSTVSNQLYDGIVDPGVTGPTGNPMRICFKNNSNPTFGDLHLDQLNGNATNLPQILTQDATAFTCELPPLPAITLALAPDHTAGER